MKDILDDLLAAALHPCHNNADFANAMFEALAGVIGFDSATLNLCKVENGYRLPELKCHFFRQPQWMAANYQRTCQTDPFSPSLLAFPFQAFDALRIVDFEEYIQSPLYLKHCRFFDVQNALAAAARFPGHLHRYLMLYLYSSTPKRLFPEADIHVLDNLFPAVVAMWHYRLGCICSETLAGRIRLLHEFRNSPKRFQLLKLVIQNPTGSSKDYARQLGCSERTVEHHLKALYDKLKLGGYNKNKKIEIYRRFQFLER